VVLDDLAVRVSGGNRAFTDHHQIKSYLQDRYPNMLPDAIDRRMIWGYTQHEDNLWRPLAAPTALDQLIQGLRTPWKDAFAEIKQPMTHIRGEESKLVTTESWQSAKQLRPNDRWVIATGSDHYIPEVTPHFI